MSNEFARNVATSPEEAARIVPRAEFRVFGRNIIRGVQERMWNGRTILGQARTMPSEIYFLSRHSDEANVKFRDGLLDIKVKVGETADGYEIFQPRGKFTFPVDRQALAIILASLQTDAPPASATCRFEDFLAMTKANRDLAAVTVEKIRYGFTIDGIVCEYAKVWFNGALLESACAESEDYDGMKTVVEDLGLAAMVNTNYLKAAKSVVGMR